jgi:hypothetical protein
MNKKIETDYPLITRLARAILSLPHSSAIIERGFSQLKLIKDEKRGNLNNDTLESLMITKINGLTLNKSEIYEKVRADEEKKKESNKRKHSEITPAILDSQDKEFKPIESNENLPKNINDDGKDSITEKLKKVKLNDDDSSHSLLPISNSEKKEIISPIGN